MCLQNIFQIFINDSGEVPTFSGYVAHAMQSLRVAYPAARHRVLGNRELRALIAKDFPPEVGLAYDTLKPYAYRSDLGRYCLLHRYGGMYVDLPVRFVSGILFPPELTFFAFRDRNMHTRKSWAVATSILYATPGCRVLENAIAAIVDHCRSRYYGATPLCPTGPTLLGRAVCEEDSESVVCPGELVDLTPHHPQRNSAFVLDSGQIVAMGKPAEGGNLAGLGLAGTNNYNDLWHARDVYAAGSL
jgi:hypothetical protein